MGIPSDSGQTQIALGSVATEPAEGLDACQHLVDLAFGGEVRAQGFVVRGGGLAGDRGNGSIFLAIRGAGCIAPAITFALTQTLINEKTSNIIALIEQRSSHERHERA